MSSSIDEQVIDTWHISNRIILYLLDVIPPKALCRKLPSACTRTVARMFVHIHHVRLARFETVMPDLMNGQIKFNKNDEALDKTRLHRALEFSGEATAEFIRRGLDQGKIPGFKPHPIGFLGYFISHEAYHCGEICMALTGSGHKVDDKILYGQWDWGRR